MNRQYEIYTIKNTINDTYFVGLTSGKGDMLKWISNKISTDNSQYKKLGESLIEHGIKSHKFTRSGIIFPEKKKGEEALEVIHNKLFKQGKLLNDSVIDSRRYKCDACGMELKVIYKDIHDEKYCTKREQEFLNQLLLSVDVEPTI